MNFLFFACAHAHHAAAGAFGGAGLGSVVVDARRRSLLGLFTREIRTGKIGRFSRHKKGKTSWPRMASASLQESRSDAKRWTGKGLHSLLSHTGSRPSVSCHLVLVHSTEKNRQGYLSKPRATSPSTGVSPHESPHACPGGR